MTELILTRGVPASGKTTWAKQYAKDYNFVRVNRDELRKELSVRHGQNEPLVTKIQHSRVKELLRNDISVIVDDTNLTARFVKEWLKLAAEQNAFASFMDFEIDYETAVARDSGRFDDSVGEEVIKSFFDRFVRKGQLPEPPVLDEGAAVKFAPYKEVEGLPHAILVDIDGTLAHMQGRSPYDPTLYHTDTLDDVIADIADAYTLMKEPYVSVVIMSGRDGGYRVETEEWLAANFVNYDELYMRPEGDKRKDDVVKNELFEEHIAGKYNVDFILDDRNRVVDMWRAKGLKVLQCADGNF